MKDFLFQYVLQILCPSFINSPEKKSRDFLFKERQE